MERLPLDRSVLDSALERMDIADIAQATIRQSGDIARILENETGTYHNRYKGQQQTRCQLPLRSSLH